MTPVTDNYPHFKSAIGENPSTELFSCSDAEFCSFVRRSEAV